MAVCFYLQVAVKFGMNWKKKQQYDKKWLYFKSLASLPSSISVEIISQMLLFGPSILYILLTRHTVILDLIPG